MVDLLAKLPWVAPGAKVGGDTPSKFKSNEFFMVNVMDPLILIFKILNK